MVGVTPVGLGLAYDHGANLRGLTDKQRVPETLQEGVEPRSVIRSSQYRQAAAGRHRSARPHRRPGRVRDPSLARVDIENGDVLLARVQIASHQ